ncbi:MAG: hypothetical protein AAB439_00040 [Patescibacteria group bacterium]
MAEKLTNAEELFDFNNDGVLGELESLAGIALCLGLPVLTFLAIFRAVGPR